VPRRSILKVVKVNYTPSAPWMVRVPTRLQSTEGSQKKFFERESVAKAYAERLARQMGEYQTQALGLTDRQKVEAAECYRILGKEDASLLEAVHHYAAYLAQAKQSAPIGQLFEKFLAAKRQDGLSSKYLADLRSKLGRFVAAFSDTLACNLTAPTLEAWLRGLTMGSVSRESYRRNISVMLEFGRRRGALRVNPAADIKITRRPEGEVTILTSEDVARLLPLRPQTLCGDLRLRGATSIGSRVARLVEHPPRYAANRGQSTTLENTPSSSGANATEPCGVAPAA
jgi:hypothetical protein